MKLKRHLKRCVYKKEVVHWVFYAWAPVSSLALLFHLNMQWDQLTLNCTSV